MKKISYLVLATLLMAVGVCGVNAASYTAPCIIRSGWGSEIHEVTIYELSVSSPNLEEGLSLYIDYSSDSSATILDGDYKIYSDHLYSYKFRRNMEANPGGAIIINPTSPGISGPIIPAEPVVEAPLDIMIQKDDLVEGTKYDVYYIDIDNSNPMAAAIHTVDEEHLGDVAEVVKIDGELYIKFEASVVKPFALELKMSEQYKESRDKLLDNGVFTFPGVKSPKTVEEGFDFYTYFVAFETLGKEYEVWPVDEYRIENEYQYATLTFNNNPNETHIIKYKWYEGEIADILKSKQSELEEALLANTKNLLDYGAFEELASFFEIEDLAYINYLNNVKELDDMDSVNYSIGLRKMLKNTNYKYHFDFRAGNATEFSSLGFGYLSLSYNGIIFPLDVTAGYLNKQVIYVPDDTADTSEALIAAAKKRIKEYLNIEDVLIEEGGLRQELIDEDPWIGEAFKEFYNVSKLSDHYYYITINGHKVKFVFEKNSEKIKEIEYKMKDLISNVEVSTKSGEIPYDAVMSVSEVFKNSEMFKQLMEKFNKEDGQVFDIKLFSASINDYVKQLKNGMFEVRIPLKEEFKGKKLSAFYFDADNNKIEEYPITIDGDYGVFTTSHFSTYTVSLASVNPDTGDNIVTYVVLGAISVLAICGTAIYLKKRHN